MIIMLLYNDIIAGIILQRLSPYDHADVAILQNTSFYSTLKDRFYFAVLVYNLH